MEPETHYIDSPEARCWLRKYVPPPPPKWMAFDQVYAKPILGHYNTKGEGTTFIKAELNGD